MPVLLCNLASAFLGSRDEDPFRRALELCTCRQRPAGRDDLDASHERTAACSADVGHPLELVDEQYRGFQTGLVGESEYARHLRSRLGWTGSDPDLVALFTDQPQAVHLGVLGVLRDLVDQGWRLIGVENTDPWRNRARGALYSEQALSPHRFVTSLDAGARLPDPRVFDAVRVHVRDSTAQETLYVDRDADNVAAARRAGLRAHLLRGTAELVAAVRA